MKKPWIEIGAEVLYHRGGSFREGDAVVGRTITGPYLRVGSRGRVVELHAGAPAHACPDHWEAPPHCSCGGRSDATIPAGAPSAVVEWTWDDGSTDRRLIRPDGEGDNWRRA